MRCVCTFSFDMQNTRRHKHQNIEKPTWAWVNTYSYHIWRNNHPLTTNFRVPRVPGFRPRVHNDRA